jgi:hypothetical protein
MVAGAAVAGAPQFGAMVVGVAQEDNKTSIRVAEKSISFGFMVSSSNEIEYRRFITSVDNNSILMTEKVNKKFPSDENVWTILQ